MPKLQEEVRCSGDRLKKDINDLPLFRRPSEIRRRSLPIRCPDPSSKLTVGSLSSQWRRPSRLKTRERAKGATSRPKDAENLNESESPSGPESAVLPSGPEPDSAGAEIGGTFSYECLPTNLASSFEFFGRALHTAHCKAALCCHFPTTFKFSSQPEQTYAVMDGPAYNLR
jgi:hypothetical protein